MSSKLSQEYNKGMAKSEVSKEKTPEKVLRVLRNIHIGIGAVALAGAVVFPAGTVLLPIAAYEGVNALAHEGLRRVIASRRKPKLSTA